MYCNLFLTGLDIIAEFRRQSGKFCSRSCSICSCLLFWMSAIISWKAYSVVCLNKIMQSPFAVWVLKLKEGVVIISYIEAHLPNNFLGNGLRFIGILCHVCGRAPALHRTITMLSATGRCKGSKACRGGGGDFGD